MLTIIGDKYKFDAYDENILLDKFGTIEYIPYSCKKSSDTIFDLNQLLCCEVPKVIVLNVDLEPNSQLQDFLLYLEELNVKTIYIDEFITKHMDKLYIQNRELENIKPCSYTQYIQKRVIDYIGAITISILALPIILYSIYRIKKESPGSIIYKQTRVGINGKKFTCYKLRTMHENSYHNPYTQSNDNRIFPWGRFMRKTRIDELPQLWNVIKGDMHLIGPRAEWDILVQKYEKDIPGYSKRYLLKPGITGWAQVNYPYGVNEHDAKQKLMYDLYYINNWSIFLDIKTLFKTVAVVLNKRGV
jgi:lipopolysaccharide/colanic/teichoic acid biosynthesis glycosyltransferase